MVGTFTEKKTLIKVDGQDRKLQLPKVKTGNAELLCHIASKFDIVILIKSDIVSWVFIVWVNQQNQIKKNFI